MASPNISRTWLNAVRDISLRLVSRVNSRGSPNVTSTSKAALRKKSVTAAIQKIKQKDKVYIVTSKNKGAIIPLSDKNGLGIKEENILDRFFAIDKLQKLKKIVNDLKINDEDLYFIDDKLLHVMPIFKNSYIFQH